MGIGLCAAFSWAAEPPRAVRDPADWGSDHVGKPLPEFAAGDECLFCHRQDVGPRWQANRHNLTMREAEPGSPALAALKQSAKLKGLPEEVKIVLGDGRRERFLRPAAEFGKVEMLSVEWAAPAHGNPGQLIQTEEPHWVSNRFGESCAGCHATAIDSRTKAFGARSLDCFVCHGEVPAEHTKNPALAILSPRRKETARVATSICAQCHLRTGKSKSLGTPYPNQFVAGDNLFRDFQVDFSDQAIRRLNPADAHVLENVRDVVVLGKDEVTCLTCHDVHKQSTRKHQAVAETGLCLHCHYPTGSRRLLKEYDVHSKTCGY